MTFDHTCEFCKEIHLFRNSRFYKIYGNRNRCIYESKKFRVFPTLGAFVPNYLLIIPQKHVESIAQLNQHELKTLENILQIIKSYFKTQHIICFEHGGTASEGGCNSVYHAHMHVICMNEQIEPTTFFSDKTVLNRTNTILECYQNLQFTNQYLMFTEANAYYSLEISKTKDNFCSQYLRQKIAKQLNCQLDWDWRNYNFQEEHVLAMLDSNIRSHFANFMQ